MIYNIFLCIRRMQTNLISIPQPRCFSVVFLQRTLLLAVLTIGTYSVADTIKHDAVPVAVHRLLLGDDGSVWGWGANGYGQLKLGGGANWSDPQRINGLPTIIGVTSGARHSLAVDLSGQVWAWGDNSSGQLGLGHTRQAQGPVQVPGLSKIKSVSAGIHHSLALAEDGTMWVWGSNSRGQLGLEPAGKFEITSSPTRLSALKAIAAIAAGGDISLGLGRDGRLSAWGAGSPQVQRVDGPEAVIELKAEGDRAIALDQSGTAWNWVVASPASTIHAVKSDADAYRAFSQDARDEVTVVSGTVLAPDGKGIAGARVLAGQTECAVSVQTGRYFCVLPHGWYGTLKAVKAGMSLERKRGTAARTGSARGEAAKASSSIEANFIQAPQHFLIAGRVLANGRGATVRASGKGASCGRVKANGQYVCTVPKGWHGTLIAARPGYVYRSRNFTAVNASVTGQDFSGQSAAAVIAAATRPPAPPATPAARPNIAMAPASPPKVAAPAAETAPARAAEAPRAPTERTPTPTPAPAPTPVSQDLRIVGTLFISGSRDGPSPAGGRPVANAVIVAEGAQCTNSDEAGNYVCTARAGWSGRIVPRKASFRFAPSALTFRGLQQNQRNQDFAAVYAPGEE